MPKLRALHYGQQAKHAFVPWDIFGSECHSSVFKTAVTDRLVIAACDLLMKRSQRLMAV
jgi:hypothetical protein